MSTLKISIVTSVLNGGAYLAEAMKSVTAQSYDNWDYLIIDAGSDDGSYEQAQAAASDPRIRVERRAGEGLYASLLWGLEQSKGDMLAWLNADDFYPSWSFASLQRFMARRPDAQWVTGLPGCWDREGRLQFVRARAWHPKSFIRRGMFHGEALGFLQQESMFFSRTLFEKLTADEKKTFAAQKYAGDFYLWKKLAEHAPLVTAPTLLGGFRQHDRNMSAANAEGYMAEARALGAWTPPPVIAAAARRLYELAAAAQAPGLMRKAEAALAAETPTP